MVIQYKQNKRFLCGQRSQVKDLINNLLYDNVVHRITWKKLISYLLSKTYTTIHAGKATPHVL